MAYSAREKKLLGFSALAIALPLGMALYANRINATPKVNIPPYPTAPNPNGYDLYVAAANMITPAIPAVDVVNDGKMPADPKVRAQKYSLARKTAWLSANKAGFALFNQAMKTPTWAPSARSSSSLSFRSYARLREMARIKVIQSNARWMRGDYYGALNSGLDAVQMGHDTRRGGNIICHLVGIAIGAIGRSVTHDTVEHLSAVQAKNAARRLETMLATRWNLDQVLTEEKYTSQASMLEMFQKQNWRSEFFSNGFSAGEPTASVAERWRRYTIPKQQIIDDIGTDYDRQITNASLPYSQKGAPSINYNNPFISLLVSLNPLSRGIDARDLVSDRLLMLSLALRAYHLENGAYPLNLKNLVPKYLKAIPADPYGGGEAMHYKSNGHTQTLWSIGPDEKDDGGTPIPSNLRQSSRSFLPTDRKRLPAVGFDSKGDIVAGKNG